MFILGVIIQVNRQKKFLNQLLFEVKNNNLKVTTVNPARRHLNSPLYLIQQLN
jgi:hypothetical protein